MILTRTIWPTVLIGLMMVTVAIFAAHAHTVAGRSLDGKAAIVEFRYSDSQPMAYAAVRVFAPDVVEVWQSGRTDGSGRFAFVPDRVGDWRVEARDEENHVAQLAITIDGNISVTASLSRFWGLVLWGSIGLNLVLLALMLTGAERKGRNRQ